MEKIENHCSINISKGIFFLSAGHQVHILRSCFSTNGYIVSFVSLAESVKEDLKVWGEMTFQGIQSIPPATCFRLTNLS